MNKMLILAIGAVLSLTSCLNVGEMEAPPELKPFPAPKLEMEELATGKKISVYEYAGKPVIVNFWATWCYPCLSEMPTLQKLHNERKDDITLLMINVKESKSVVEKFLKDNDYTFKVLIDENGDAYREFQVFGLPTTYFIDSTSTVRYNYIGELRRGVMKMGMKSISVEWP